MCTRYYIEKNPKLDSIIQNVKHSSLTMRMIAELGRPIVTEGEVRPTDIVPVLAPDKNGKQSCFPMIWGFRTKSILFNARVETAAQKPTFQKAWNSHRCIIPASWYFEWFHYTTSDGKKKTGDKYMIQPKNSDLTWLAGLYQIDNGYPYFVVLTKDPSEEVRQIHDRMPVILPEEYIESWISPDSNPNEIITYALSDMFMEIDDGSGYNTAAKKFDFE